MWTGKYASVDKKHDYDLDDVCSKGVQLCVLIKLLTDLQLCPWEVPATLVRVHELSCIEESTRRVLRRR